MLGLLLYSLYTTSPLSVISKYPGICCYFYVNDTQIYLSFSPAKSLGVIFQSDMSMDKHISAIVKSCFLQLRNFHRIYSFISNTATITLANAFVRSHFNYCNSLF